MSFLCLTTRSLSSCMCTHLLSVYVCIYVQIYIFIKSVAIWIRTHAKDFKLITYVKVFSPNEVTFSDKRNEESNLPLWRETKFNLEHYEFP